MDNLHSAIEQLAMTIQRDKQYDEKAFHKTSLLLKIYRDVTWRTLEVLRDVDERAFDFGGRQIAELVDYLSLDIEGEIDKLKLQDRLMSVAETKVLIDIIDKSLVILKGYPHYGNLYFDILTKKFIYNFKYTDEDLIEALNIGQTMFYRRKKEAINLLGTILWGYVLPPLKAYM